MEWYRVVCFWKAMIFEAKTQKPTSKKEPTENNPTTTKIRNEQKY